MFKLERASFSHIALVVGIFEYWKHIQNPVTFSIALISFILFYGAIYAMNDIADYKIDKVTPENRKRVITSGKVTIKQSVKIVIVTWFFTLTAMWIYAPSLAIVSLILLAINVVYSWFMKGIPYLDILFVSSTQPIKFYLALSLCGIAYPPLLSILPQMLVLYFVFILMHSEKQLGKVLEGEKRIFIFGKYTKSGLENLGYFGLILSIVSLAFAIHSPEFLWCFAGVIMALVFRFKFHATKSLAFVRRIEGTFQPK